MVFGVLVFSYLSLISIVVSIFLMITIDDIFAFLIIFSGVAFLILVPATIDNFKKAINFSKKEYLH